ncbi:MAG: hypothetical protein MN733_02425 [Nitrososphaera sp.]|nr:hypothetical protein [Nitrososphaera sp.]
MPPVETTSFPFLTRKMLSFEHNAVFGLRIAVQSSVTSPIVIRGLTREGVFAFQLSPTADSAIVNTNFRIPDIPIALSVVDLAAVLVQGETFVTVSLTINGDVVQQLMSGWVYNQKALSWPVISGDDQRPGGGRLLTITGDNPAAGAECSDTVPSGQIWKIHIARLNLVADATAANRLIHLVLNDGTTDYADFFTTIAHTASENKFYTFSSAATNSEGSQDNDIAAVFPEFIWLPEAHIIKTETTAIQAGDNYAAPIYMVERFFTPA